MTNDEFNQLVRIAQVLKVRTRNLFNDLAAKNGPASAKARIASELAQQIEDDLIEIYDSVSGN